MKILALSGQIGLNPLIKTLKTESLIGWRTASTSLRRARCPNHAAGLHIASICWQMTSSFLCALGLLVRHLMPIEFSTVKHSFSMDYQQSWVGGLHVGTCNFPICGFSPSSPVSSKNTLHWEIGLSKLSLVFMCECVAMQWTGNLSGVYLPSPNHDWVGWFWRWMDGIPAEVTILLLLLLIIISFTCMITVGPDSSGLGLHQDLKLQPADYKHSRVHLGPQPRGSGDRQVFWLLNAVVLTGCINIDIYATIFILIQC